MKSDEASSTADWDPTPSDVRADSRAAHDELRRRCPVARDRGGSWLLLRHEDIRRAASDPVTFSSAASRFKSVPNSMDGDEHRRFRELIDRFFEPTRIEALVPMFREVAEEVVAALPRGAPVDAVDDLGLLVAVRAQSRWLGWPAELEPRLCAWVHDNQQATRSGELSHTRDVAARFEAIIREQVEQRRSMPSPDLACDDVTSELMRARVLDPAAPGGERLLTEAETVSVLRNWTAGDLGSIARAFGVVVQYLVTHSEVQITLRSLVADSASLNQAIDEMLRIDDPFVFNRRVTTREVEIGGRTVPQGARVLLSWTAANRDPAVFGEPDAYRPKQNAEHNLVYGIGPHACPGRALATHELREALTALFRRTNSLVVAPGQSAVRAMAPLGGYARVPVMLV
jgi:cytochrome P450